MQEIDRLYFNKYSMDPESELDVFDGSVDEYNNFEFYDVDEAGVDEEAWPELD